jgi:hypothetical protein
MPEGSLMIRIHDKDVKINGRLVRVARIDGEEYRFCSDLEAIADRLKRSKTRVDLFTFFQPLSEGSVRYPYPIEWDNRAALPLSTFDHWWTNQIDSKTRNMVRKAEKKGLTVAELEFSEQLVAGVHGLYNECAVRQGKAFEHYGKDIETVRNHLATFLDCSFFIGAFLEGQMIGFMKLTMNETGSQAGIMHILSMIRHRDKAPNNLLITQAVRSCTDRNIKHLVYSRFSDGKKERDSLSDFKTNNGFVKVDTPRYFVPLTAFGKVAFRLGLHHKISERMPESVGSKLRQLRRYWYDRKLQAMAQA